MKDQTTALRAEILPRNHRLVGSYTKASLGLFATLLVPSLLLSGCAADSGNAPTVHTKTPPSSQSASPTPSPTASPTATTPPAVAAPVPESEPTQGDATAPSEPEAPQPADLTVITSNGYDKRAAWDACLSAAESQYKGSFTSYSDFDANSVQSAAEVDPGSSGVLVSIPWTGEYKGTQFASTWLCLARGDQAAPSVVSVDVPEGKA